MKKKTMSVVTRHDVWYSIVYWNNETPFSSHTNIMSDLEIKILGLPFFRGGYYVISFIIANF
jgi:hypothetical protein